jgi:hypothetical protein
LNNLVVFIVILFLVFCCSFSVVKSFNPYTVFLLSHYPPSPFFCDVLLLL